MGPRTLARTHGFLGLTGRGGRDWAEVEWTLTIGCPQLGLQWTQDRARREVGGQVEFPMAGTILWEWQAGSQVLYPVCVCVQGVEGELDNVMPNRLNSGTRDPITAPETRVTPPRQAESTDDPRAKQEMRGGLGSPWHHTPAGVLVPQASVQQEHQALI